MTNIVNLHLPNDDRYVFEEIADAMPHMVWLADLEGAGLYHNRCLLEYAGLTPSGALGSGWLQMVHPDDQLAVQISWARSHTTGVPYESECRLRNSLGEYRWFLVRGRLQQDDVGRAVRWVGTCTDVTDRIISEDRVRESERRYRELFEANPHPMWVYETETLRFLAVNDAAIEQYEYSRDEFLTMTAADIHPPEELPTLLADIRAGDTGIRPQGVRRHRHKNGTIRSVEVTAHTLQFADRPARLVMALDVTDRVEAEEATTRVLARLQAVVESLYDGVVVADPEGNLLGWNSSALRILGFSSAEAAPGTVPAFFESVAVSRPDGTPLTGDTWPVALILRGQGVADEELVLRRRATDTELIVRCSGAPVLGPTGKVELAVMTIHDVTRWKRAESDARRVAGLLRAVADGTSDAVYVKDREGRYLLFNEAAAGFVGKAVAEVIGKDDTSLFEPDSARFVMELDRRVMQSGQVVTNEEVLSAGGVTRTYQATKAPYRDASGKVIGLIGISRDVSDRKQAEAALRESEERLRVALAAAGAVAFVWDVAADQVVRYHSVEPALPVNLGAPETLADVLSRIHPKDRDQFKTGVKACLAAGTEYRNLYRVVRVDGSVRYIEEWGTLSRDAAGSPVRLVGISIDVTDRRKAEEALVEREELLRTIINHIPCGIFWKTRESVLLGCNIQFAKDFGGRSPEDLIGKTDELIASPADADVFVARDRQVIERGEPLLNVEESQSRADGGTVTRLTSKVPLRGIGGAVIGVLGVYQDITDRKKAEVERVELLARLNLQIERMPLVYLLTDSDFRYVRWNPAAERTFGFTQAEVLGKHPFEVLVPPQARPLVATIFDRLATGDMNAHGSCENVTRDGRTIVCEWFNTPLFNQDGTFQGVLSLAQDVTGRRVLEEQFRQSQKMDAIGRLAGGVAHDFNNLLTIINGYADILVESTPPTSAAHSSAVEIRDAGERATRLTAQLLAFSRKSIVVPSVLDLNAVVTQSTMLLRRLIGEDILLAADLEAELPRVKADVGQIDQVILNIAVNARDAMPTGGRLTIKTRQSFMGTADATAYPGVEPGGYVELSMTDTGCGMTEEVKAKLFEPFFTTKGVGKGTGLGLATVYGVVRASGGHVVVESEIGVGTTFRILFPAVAGAAERRPADEVAAPQRGSETLLVVEDEPAVRRLTTQILKKQGYVVLEAGSGAEALLVARNHCGPLELLVTDVVMPGMSGREVAEALRQSHPGLKVLYLSGYTDDAVLRHGIVEATDAFLQKPFTPDAIARKARGILDAGR